MDQRDLENINILIVGGDGELANILRIMLAGLGMGKVRISPDADQGLWELSAYPLDLVICDAEATPRGGIDFVYRLRQVEDEKVSGLPVILLSGRPERAEVEAARDGGVTEYLAKPIAAQALHDRIVYMVENPREFVRAPRFIGPDRRRRGLSHAGTERRG